MSSSGEKLRVLAEAGILARVSHVRRLNLGWVYGEYQDLHRGLEVKGVGDGFVISRLGGEVIGATHVETRGGMTVVELVRASAASEVGVRAAAAIARGVAVCSEEDDYSRTVGLAIALGRAVKELRSMPEAALLSAPDLLRLDGGRK